jgi:hypothetical protein
MRKRERPEAMVLPIHFEDRSGTECERLCGLAEPPEPIVTGNAAADAVDVQPHELETYDALFASPEDPEPDHE